MTTLLPKEEIKELLHRQLSNFFPISDKEREIISEAFPVALLRCEKCFKGIENKYYHKGDEVFFSPFHSGQWLLFLLYLANTVSLPSLTVVNKWGGVNKVLADKIYYLNKIMHSVDIYHEIEIPDVMFFEHPVGTVLGRGKYQNGLIIYQNCTVGGNKGHYPTIGKNFHMMSGSKILGNSIVGDNVTLAANTYVKDTNIPSDSTVFGSSPNLIIKYLSK